MVKNPLYCNDVDLSLTKTSVDGEMVELHFYFRRPNMKPENIHSDLPYSNISSGPTVIMPRCVAKGMFKKFLGIMSMQDETRP